MGSKKKTPQRLLTEELLEKYPMLPSKTIARMVTEQFPDCSVENIRNMARTCRGRHGEYKRRYGDKKFHLPLPTATNAMSLPSSLASAYVDYHVPRDMAKGLFLVDTHFPYHNRKVVELILQYGKWFNPDFIILGHDMLDCYQVSTWKRDPSKTQIVDEMKTGNQFLTAVRVQFPKAEIIYKMGNHEDRFRDYIKIHAKELWGLEELTLPVLLGTYDLGIEVVDDKRRMHVGKLISVHGHEWWGSIQNPVNPARGLFLRAKSSAICAHFHQTSEHTEPTIKDEMITCWSIGCACDLHPEYMPINRWNHGFATIEKVPSGNFKLVNHRIMDGELV